MAAASAPPRIFSSSRRAAVRARALALQQAADAPHYILDDMVEDVADRLGFLRHAPARSLVIGDWTGQLARQLPGDVTEAEPAHGFDHEAPLPFGGFDFIACLGTLDTVNDLPGALIHLRGALAQGGLLIAQFMGAGCLPHLRAAMLAADADRPAPRLHPMVDVRAGGQLLQRAGLADPVIDYRTLSVSFGSFDRLIGDLRAQGLSNVLASPGPALGKAALARARAAFGDGRVTERFEILSLSGWRR